jgi:putative transposase
MLAGLHHQELALTLNLAPITVRIMQMILAAIRVIYADRSQLVLENLALRQQLAVYKRKQPRPRLNDLDRAFWTALKNQFSDWADALIIVKPDTVVRWQKQRFRNFWRRKSKPGRPTIERQHIEFIKRISGDHPEYGEDRIALELKVKFGIEHSPATVRKYMVRPSRPRRDSLTWRTFLKNQADAIWSCDFCVQPTVRFTTLYLFVVMELGSRKVVHVNVTEHPSLDWVKQQIRDASFEEQPKFLIHDNDGIFGQLGKPAVVEVNGKKVSCRSSLDVWLAEAMGIRGIPTPYHAPNANAHVERLIGTLRRELLDRILIWNERQLRAVVNEYVHWFNGGRVHQGIQGIPDPDPELPAPRPAAGELVAMPVCGGLHHDYRLVA